MKFEEVEQIGIALFGDKWQSQLAGALNIPRGSVQNWRRQGVPKGLREKLNPIIQKRKSEIMGLNDE